MNRALLRHRSMQVGLFTALVILLAMGFVCWRALQETNDEQRWVAHTYQVLEQLEPLTLQIANLDAAYRGYVASGDAALLLSARESLQQAGRQQQALQILTADNAEQQGRSATLASLRQQVSGILEDTMSRRPSPEPAAVKGRASASGKILAGYRDVAAAMQTAERLLLKSRTARARVRQQQAVALLIIGSVAGFALLAAAAWISRRDRIALSNVQATLFASNEYLRVVAELSDYSVCTLDPTGVIVAWYAGAAHMHGYAATEVVGRNYSLVFAQADIDQGAPEQGLREAAAQGRLELYGYRTRKDGTRFHAHVVLTATRSASGELMGFSKITRDISERRNHEARFAGLLEAAPDAMVISDTGGRILGVNAHTEKLFGYARADLVGLSMDILVPHALSADRELRGLHKNATEFPVEISVSSMNTTDGVVIISAVRDVTARLQSMWELVSVERKFRTILESAPEAMVILDSTGHIYLVNAQAERLFGYARGELIGKRVELLMPARYRHNHEQHRLDYLDDPLTRMMGEGLDPRGVRSNGEEFPVEIVLSPLDDADEKLVTAVIRDITDRKRAEDYLLKTVRELRRANEELQQFAYLASHDLQEPLRMVASYTQLLASRYKGRLDADADEFIGFAVEGATRMQKLIQDLLTYSREGEESIQVSPGVSSEHALQAALTNLQLLVESSGAVVTNGPLPPITTNELQLVRIFQNLIGNAVKYRAEAQPAIHVSAAADDGTWHFQIRDNGIGIEPRHFEKIFVLFQRLHGPKEYEGTGMGLAICKKAVERLGGRIWVTSVPGTGSTFHFSLPGSMAA